MKFLITLVSALAMAAAQRPTYAGLSSKGYPELANRFRDPADDQNDTASNVAVGNRLGADDQTLQNLPTDARGDAILVNRLNQWPRENRPFWLINSEHINSHRHPNERVNTVNQPTNQQGGNVNTVQQGTQQRLNEIQPTFNENRQGLEQQQQNVGTNAFGVQANGGQIGQVQSRLDGGIATETRTIKPLSQRGSFAGGRK